MQEHESQSIAALIAAQKPGHSLDQRFYTDPGIYELELEKIISRNWFLAGHVSELAEPGDFKVWIGPSSQEGLEGEFELVE